MKPVHHLIDARGIKLHVVEQGNGPLILFCHGFPATWLCWRSAMQAAADDGYRRRMPHAHDVVVRLEPASGDEMQAKGIDQPRRTIVNAWRHAARAIGGTLLHRALQ